jgi:hypothetical protein
MARRLAGLGVPAVRFDYCGTGNGSGCFSKVSLDTLIKDIDIVQEHAVQSRGTCLAGARFGATLAMLYSASRHFDGPVVLWDPILDLKKYLKTSFINKTLLDRKMMRDGSNAHPSIMDALSEDGFVELSCLRFGRVLFEQLERFDAGQTLRASVARGLILMPDAPLSSESSRALDELRRKERLSVKNLSIKRGHLGWGAEDFSENSEMIPALERETIEYLSKQSGALTCGASARI